MTELKICTFNCNGLGEFRKRKDVFNYLRNELKIDIAMLQECHLPESTENFVRSAWGADGCLLAGNSDCTNKNGVGILINNTFEYKIHDVVRDQNGCYIIIDIELSKKRLLLVNMYGPSDADNPDFFERVFQEVDRLRREDHFIVGAGDLNCRMNPDFDSINYTGRDNRAKTREKIREIMNSTDLVDVWRELHVTKPGYTWRKFKSTKQGRLDHFLVSGDFLTQVKQISIKPSYKSDHSPLVIALRAEERQRGKPMWRFNNSLLKDKDYVQTIKAKISNVKAQYMLPVYNPDQINEIANDEVQFTINDQLFFEVLLMEIRASTIAYSINKKKEENMREKELTMEITKLESDINIHNLKELEDKKEELEKLRTKRLNGMIIRSRAQWLLDGEKTSKYFCSLESRNYINKSVSFLESSTGEMLYSNQQILHEAKCFYHVLYSERDTADVNLDTVINSAPKLTDEDNENIKGLLSYNEAKIKLSKMPHNKSPGSDGFSVELFKFFFKDIGHFLVRSINHGFVTGELSATQKQGIITIIPKEGKDKQHLKNWRPITLLNVPYKIASACIAERMKKMLPKIIHTDQKGFMAGRYIGENIRLLYDVLYYTEKENIPGMLLAIDFEKAFDSVSWSFIQKALSFFNFGPDIINWVETFYKNANTCVTVNGHYSGWFNIGRGVRQGDPLSPYLYLICAETLLLMLRENVNIGGIRVNEGEILLSQFADDTTVCLDGSEESFCEAIRVLEAFTTFSGLKMNTEKTQVIWIGSLKKSRKRYLRDKNFCWDPGIFKILGVKFSTDLERIPEINYEGKLQEIKKLLNTWSKRQITPFGKITVLKSLAVSKLTHLFTNLPDPPIAFLKELDKMFFDFLWSGRSHKIKKSVVCKDYNDGGLRMINVFDFLSTLKISWLRRIRNEESEVRQILFTVHKDFNKVCLMGEEFVNVMLNRMDNAFWKDTLKHLKKLYAVNSVQNQDDFVSECIFYNKNIKVGKKTLYIRDWYLAGILSIYHLLDHEGKFYKFMEFRKLYPELNVNFLTYEGIVRAIKRYQEKIRITITSEFSEDDPLVWRVVEGGNGHVQKAFVNTKDTAAGPQRWNTIFPNLNWKKIFVSGRKTTSDVKLRWLQYRIVHRIIPTNRYLHIRKVIDSAECTFCGTDEETIEHLFYECTHVASFWNNLLITIKEKCIHCYNLTFPRQLILFGTCQNFGTDKVIDLIIILAKFHIYMCKWKKIRPDLTCFLRILKDRFNLEKYCQIMKEKSHDFNMLWTPYLHLIN
jgi:exonuclease III